MKCPRTKLSKSVRDPCGEQVYRPETATVRKETAAQYRVLSVAGDCRRAGGVEMWARSREADVMRFSLASQLPTRVSCCSAGFSVPIFISLPSYVSFLLLFCPLSCGSVPDILCHQNYLMFPSLCIHLLCYGIGFVIFRKAF